MTLEGQWRLYWILEWLIMCRSCFAVLQSLLSSESMSVSEDQRMRRACYTARNAYRCWNVTRQFSVSCCYTGGQAGRRLKAGCSLLSYHITTQLLTSNSPPLSHTQLRSTVVERWSLTGELSLSCAWLLAGRMIGSDVRCRSANKANSAFHPHGVD